MARRIGEPGSGYRTVGYDPNPRGLSGTNSNNRRLAGTTATASDYKNAKKRKQDEKNEKVKLGEKPPYDDDGGIPGHNGIVYNTEFDDDANKDYKEEPVVIGKGVEDTNGEGWTLSVRLDEVGKVITMADWNNNRGNVEGVKEGTIAYFYIIDVSRQGNIKLPTSPLENGMVKHDHKVIMPKTFRVTGYVKRENTVFINSLLSCAEQSKSLKSYFSLSSPWYNFEKMYLQKYTSKASNRKYDVYDYTIDLTQLLTASNLTDKTSDAELASNKEKGTAKGK